MDTCLVAIHLPNGTAQALFVAMTNTRACAKRLAWRINTVLSQIALAKSEQYAIMNMISIL
jgi:hypothetical protein